MQLPISIHGELKHHVLRVLHIPVPFYQLPWARKRLKACVTNVILTLILLPFFVRSRFHALRTIIKIHFIAFDSLKYSKFKMDMKIKQFKSNNRCMLVWLSWRKRICWGRSRVLQRMTENKNLECLETIENARDRSFWFRNRGTLTSLVAENSINFLTPRLERNTYHGIFGRRRHKITNSNIISMFSSFDKPVGWSFQSLASIADPRTVVRFGRRTKWMDSNATRETPSPWPENSSFKRIYIHLQSPTIIACVIISDIFRQLRHSVSCSDESKETAILVKIGIKFSNSHLNLADQ